MKKKRRVLAWLLAAALFAGLSIPIPVSAANLYFTAVNNSVASLTSDAMPLWYNGTIYVPYTVFDASLNGIGVSLGLNVSYNRSSNLLTLFDLRQMLVFDLNNGTCRDEMTGVVYSARAIMRNGKPYLALNTVCTFFDLEYSYSQLPYIPQGYLVRIKNADAVLDDASFIDQAQDLISMRLQEYTQSLSPAGTTSPTPSTPQRPSSQPTSQPEEDESSTTAYLAFRCESGAGLESILDSLDNGGRCAVFFLTPEVLEEERDLVRRMLGTGHSVGILASGEGQAAAELERGRRVLEELAHTRTTLAYVPSGQSGALEREGWVCWRETVLLEPNGAVGPAAFSASAVSRLGNRNSIVYLTLESGENAARVLSTLLRYLENSHFLVDIPMETRL